MKSFKLGLVALVALAGAGAAQADTPRGPFGLIRNIVKLDQKGRNNGAAVAQTGAGNATAITQAGADNTGRTTQAGDGNATSIRQVGKGNMAAIDQTGNSNAACIVQIGHGLDAQTVQTGAQSSGVIQTNKGAHYMPADVCMAADGHPGQIKRMVKASLD